MIMRRGAAFVVRPLVVVASAALVALVPGCHHRRAAMRPAYVTPGCSSCAPGAAPTVDGAAVPASAPVDVAPGGSVPAGPGSLPAPTEPELQPAPANKSATPDLKPPLGYQRNPQTLAPSAVRAALRSRVQPFVNDPGDLFAPPKADRPWRYVVLHHSAHSQGSLAQIDRDHRKTLGTQGCGYHFVIGNGSESPDGQIEVARRWSDQKAGAHCRDARSADVNDYGIGICLIGDLDHDKPTAKQIESAKALVAYLRDRYQIPAGRIGTHAVLAQGPTACPGRNFPTSEILGGRSLAAR